MKYFSEWKQCRKEVHEFNRMLLSVRLGAASIFTALVFFSIYLVLYSPIMLIFSVIFVSVMWILDKRYSLYLTGLAAKSVQLERMMREELSGTVIAGVYDKFTPAEKAVVPVFYTIMIMLGILLAWITIASRVSTYLGFFYVGLVVYLALYAYWIMRIMKE